MSWDHILCHFRNPCPPPAMWSPRASQELGDSPWKFPPQLLSPSPPARVPASQSSSPRTRSLALGQLLGLFMTFYLRVCALALCTQETSSPVNTHVLLQRRTGLQGNALLSCCLHGPTVSPPLVHSSWFGSCILRIERERSFQRSKS